MVENYMYADLWSTRFRQSRELADILRIFTAVQSLPSAFDGGYSANSVSDRISSPALAKGAVLVPPSLGLLHCYKFTIYLRKPYGISGGQRIPIDISYGVYPSVHGLRNQG